MTKYITNLLFISTALLITSMSLYASSRDEQLANVTVYAHTLDGKAAYTYTIENTGDRSIIGFSIGFDHYTGSSELNGVHPHEIVTPDSWQSRIISLEASPYYEVRWEPISGTANLEPGNVKNGFTVVMDNPNSQLLNSHWTAIIDGPPTYASSLLVVSDVPPDDLDIIPPNISVVVEPSIIWPPNNKMVNVTTSVTVNDNSDDNPVVLLVSVSCNECDPTVDVKGAEIGTADFNFSVRSARTGQAKSGRMYTLVYSATDAAGNSSEASAVITIPHDQRNK